MLFEVHLSVFHSQKMETVADVVLGPSSARGGQVLDALQKRPVGASLFEVASKRYLAGRQPDPALLRRHPYFRHCSADFIEELHKVPSQQDAAVRSLRARRGTQSVWKCREVHNRIRNLSNNQRGVDC